MFSDQARQITFHNYQELAGCVVRGTAEERTKLIFQIVPKDSANKVSISVELFFCSRILSLQIAFFSGTSLKRILFLSRMIILSGVTMISARCTISSGLSGFLSWRRWICSTVRYFPWACSMKLHRALFLGVKGKNYGSIFSVSNSPFVTEKLSARQIIICIKRISPQSKRNIIVCAPLDF